MKGRGARFLSICVLAGVELYPCAHAARADAGDSPTVILAVAPQTYPAIAVQARAEGVVTVEVTVDSAGEVVKAQIADVQGPPRIFRQPWLEDLARERKFRASKGSLPRKARLRFIFRLLPRGTPREKLGTRFVPPTDVEIRDEQPEEIVLHGR